MTTRNSMLADQAAFNAATLELARGFSLSAADRARIAASDYPVLDLRMLMQSYIWWGILEQCREKLGYVLMPQWVEHGIARAWDACGDQFIEIADAKFASLNERY